MALTTDEQRRLRLLEWIFDNGRGQHEVSPFYEGSTDSWSVSHEDVRELKSQGLVTAYFEGNGAIDAELTPDGRSVVERHRMASRNPSARRWACRGALVQWLDVHNARGSLGSAVTWDGLAGDASSAEFHGTSFSEAEVDEAAAWLVSNGFIDGEMMSSADDGPGLSFLLGDGQRCAEDFDCDVRAFVGAQDPGVTSIVVNGDHVQIASGPGAQQSMYVGVSRDDLAAAIQGLFDLASRMATAGDDLARSRDAAVADLRSAEPSGGAVRVFIDHLLAVAHQSGNTAFVAAITLATNDLLMQSLRLMGHA